MAVRKNGRSRNEMLNESQKNRLLDLFGEGAKLQTHERATFVLRSCEDDPLVRGELAELLNVEQARMEGFLTEPVAAVPQDLAAEFSSDTPTGNSSAGDASEGSAAQGDADKATGRARINRPRSS